MSFEYFIGRRYLRSKSRQRFISLITLLSVAGVTVGVMALIIIIAVMSGFEADLKSRILGVRSHLVVNRTDGKFTDYRQSQEKILKIPGVAAVTPMADAQVILRTNSGGGGAVLKGVDPASAGKVIKELHPEILEFSRNTDDSDPAAPGVILGSELARNLGVFTGDDIYLISPRGMISPIGHMPAMRRFTLVGLFESGMYEYDNTLAFIHIEDAQKLLRMGDAVSSLEIRLDNMNKVDAVSEQIRSALGPDYTTLDWREMNRSFFSALQLEKTAMFVILTLIVLVAAFNIAGSLIMMVMEKTRDIAILKAMGATDLSIRKIFIFKGITIGCIGTGLGIFLGLVLCLLLEQYQFVQLPPEVYYITTLPVKLNPVNIVITAVSAVAICFLATLYPARQASRLDPVEALRYG